MVLTQLSSSSVPSRTALGLPGDWIPQQSVKPVSESEHERPSSTQLPRLVLAAHCMHLPVTGHAVGNMAALLVSGRRHALFLSGLVLLLLFSLRYFPTGNLGPLLTVEEQQAPPDGEDTERGGDRAVVATLPLPPEYNTTRPGPSSEPQSQFCKDRFSTKFLEDFRDRRAGYCSESSTSDLTCFHTVNSGSFASGSLDSFCIAQNNVVFDVKQQKFAFDCQIRDLSDQEKALGAAPFEDLQSYQYLTGPRYILNEWVDLKWKKTPKFLHGSPVGSSKAEERSFLLLLKREVDGNLW